MGDVRRERLAGLVTLPAGVGLEIGPLAEPIVLAQDHDVRYVDVFDQERLRHHYRDDPGVECDDIPVMDFTLTTEAGVVTLAEAVRADAPYAYIVACHVIEHVPDLIGWLADVAEILEDQGLLILVVPDKRHCFDLYRHQTSVGQMLLAADAHDRTPSVRAVYDHFRQAVEISAQDTWKGILQADPEAARLYTRDAALSQVEQARAGQYVDCHVWTFTPDVLVEQMTELAALGLCEFAIEELLPTPSHALEFYVAMRRLPRGVDEAAKRAQVDAFGETARALLQGAPKPPNSLTGQCAEDVSRLEAQLRASEERITEVSRRLDEVMNSRQWRAGGAAMWPMRQLRRASQPLISRHGMPPPSPEHTPPR